jgi:hypothetical protein
MLATLGEDGYELGTHCMNLQKKVGNNFVLHLMQNIFFIFFCIVVGIQFNILKVQLFHV